MAFTKNLETWFDSLCSLGDERPQKAGRHYSMVYDSKIPDLVFEFRYRSSAMLQALGIIPPPKREAPSVIDIEDEEILPPPKRQKGEHDEDRMRSMQVSRNSFRVKPVLPPNHNFHRNRRS